MDQNKRGKKNSADLSHLDLDTVNAASSMECTGLIPANPQNDDAQQSYQEVCEFRAPKAGMAKNKKL